jgi:hypothetical protein
MKKLLISVVMVAVVVIALGTAGFVYAQSATPEAPVPGNGYGMMGGRGMRGGMMGQGAGYAAQDGLMHAEMIAAFAEKLGISVDDLNARLAKGETMAQIATAQGLTVEEFRTLMTDARSQAIAQAVKNGTLTQEQADWMNQRGAGRMMGGGRGMRGAGQGTSGCPYYQTNP